MEGWALASGSWTLCSAGAHAWTGWLYNPCRVGGTPTLHSSGGQNQRWPTSRPGGYITPATLRVPNASQRGTKSVVAHKWAEWLHNHRRLAGPQRTWPRSGPSGYTTPAAWGVPNASQQWGTKSEVAHKRARWLHNPYRLGGPQRLTAVGDKIRSGPQAGRGLHNPYRLRGSPTLHSSGGQNQMWPTSRPGGY